MNIGAPARRPALANTSCTGSPSRWQAAITWPRMIPSSAPQARSGVNTSLWRTQNTLAAAAQTTSPAVFSISASSAPAATASARATTLSR